MSARDVVETYLAAINAADLAKVEDLLDEDAVLLHQLGTFDGAQAMLGFYADVVFPAKVSAEPEGWVEGGDAACVVQLLAHSPLAPDKDLHYIDVFRLNDKGKVASLAIYSR
jgi:ketosteroid isomerase-like protein